MLFESARAMVNIAQMSCHTILPCCQRWKTERRSSDRRCRRHHRCPRNDGMQRRS